ncbi:Emopamil-binding protein [Choiromyces venosus 120613-1]|uniref:Emopamil-binding protein n=1 Tax=Choiromyces venosus 120613-1 TaxID=1336337 RepID=A0A3N4JGA3_9PEZI|nr:Emopamil-binding protein [Choiromyces venosus 120613-1]
MKTSHPFYPLGLSLPHYVPNTLSSLELVSTFAAGTLVIFAGARILVNTVNKKPASSEKIVCLWFALCGFIHLFFEGYFGATAGEIASSTHIFAQLWREYALSDSRYMSYDAFTVAMEWICALFCGPISFYLVYAITTNHPSRYPLQMMVSLAQLYGDALYYATAAIEVYGSTRPESYYFWVYFVMLNAFWIVIPSYLLYRGFVEVVEVFKRDTAPGKKGKAE